MNLQNLLVLDLSDFALKIKTNKEMETKKPETKPASDDYGSDLDDFDLNLENYGEENFDFELDAAVDDFGFDHDDPNIKVSDLNTPEEHLLLESRAPNAELLDQEIRNAILAVGQNSVKMIVAAQDNEQIPASKQFSQNQKDYVASIFEAQ